MTAARTLFWSDTHFWHTRIIELSYRPYATVEEMNEGLIDRWNATVRPSDRVFFGGDFALGGASVDVAAIFDRLNGEKHLVRGNHDEDHKRVLRLPWASQADLITVREGGKGGMRAVVCHYPLDTWKHPAKYLMLHGHSHGTLETVRPRRFDVGADVFWSPVTFEELWENAPAYEPVDHHARTEN